MPSSYTTSLKLTLPATGENAGTWGTLVNDGITTLVDRSIAGTTSIALNNTTDYTLSIGDGSSPNESRYMFITATGTITSTWNVICPALSKLYVFTNNTVGGYAVTFKTLAGVGILVPNGKRVVLYCNGTDVLDGITHANSLTLATALPVTSGGTGVTTSTGSGANVLATSPTLVTPLLGTPASGVMTNVTGLPLTTAVTGTLPVGNGGTGAITLTGLVKGNGTSAFTAAAAGTDYVAPGGALGTPSSGTLTNATGLPLATGVTGTLPVGNGGTGSTTLTLNNVLLGNGTSALQVVAPSTSGNVLTSNGTTWQSVAPSTGGGALSSITAATTSATIANGNNPIAWNWTQTTASQTGFSIGETTASTGGAGAQYLFKVGTLTASTADPMLVQARGGNAIRVFADGKVYITGGNGTNTGLANGSTVAVNAGDGAVSGGAGGQASLSGGTGNGTTGAVGGNAIVQGGTGATNFNGGNVTVQSGIAQGTGISGDTTISVRPGGSSGGRAGILNITGGVSNAAQSGNSGGVVITGGNAGAVASVVGGPIVLTGGAGSVTTTGGVGGAVTITAGAGGLAAAGGVASLIGGNGGSSGAGGAVAITAGNGTSAVGGDITLTTGTGSTNGSINFVNTNVANGAVATTLTSVGPTGAATTVQGWLAIKVGGTARYIPFW